MLIHNCYGVLYDVNNYVYLWCISPKSYCIPDCTNMGIMLIVYWVRTKTYCSRLLAHYWLPVNAKKCLAKYNITNLMVTKKYNLYKDCLRLIAETILI